MPQAECGWRAMSDSGDNGSRIPGPAGLFLTRSGLWPPARETTWADPFDLFRKAQLNRYTAVS
jgi:hypothetical protein